MILRTELTSDPLGRGYSAMTDVDAAADLNTVYRVRDRTLIPTYEIFEALTAGDLTTLLADNRFSVVMGMAEVSVEGVNTRAILADVFSVATTATKQRLKALETEPVSRAQELDLGRVLPGHVGMARAA